MQTTLISPYGLAAPFGTKKTVPLEGTGELGLSLAGGVDVSCELGGALGDEGGDEKPLAGTDAEDAAGGGEVTS